MYPTLDVAPAFYVLPVVVVLVFIGLVAFLMRGAERQAFEVPPANGRPFVTAAGVLYCLNVPAFASTARARAGACLAMHWEDLSDADCDAIHAICQSARDNADA